MLWSSIRHADGDLVRIEGGVVRLRVSQRARRVSLRVDRAAGEVIAVAPSVRRLADAAAFALERRQWVAERLAELPTKRPFRSGEVICIFGQPAELGWAPGRASIEASTWECGARLPLDADDAAFSRAVVGLLRRESLAWFRRRCEVHCATLRVATPRISIMNARTRWGSCSQGTRGRPASIRFSWRLALAPPATADYVAVHECAHLLEANHGPRFWAHVRSIVGDERPHRRWLRREGAALHGFGV